MAKRCLFHPRQGSVGGVAMLVVAAFTVSACSDAGSKPTSQVLATVDGSELTIQMLEGQLAALPAGVDRQDPSIRRETLDRMVTETLFAQKAQDAGLDKVPTTDRKLASVRRAVLANAYADSLQDGYRPSNAEVEGYFNSHPEIFTQRRRYRLLSLPVQSSPDDVAPYMTAFNRGDRADAMVARFKANGVAAQVMETAGNSDQMPEKLAKPMAKMNAGSRFTYREGNVQNFVWIQEVSDVPVSLAIARPTIHAFLLSRHKAEAASRQALAMRSGDAVVYGDVGRSIMAQKDGVAAAPAQSAAKADSVGAKPAAGSLARVAAGL